MFELIHQVQRIHEKVLVLEERLSKMSSQFDSLKASIQNLQTAEASLKTRVTEKLADLQTKIDALTAHPAVQDNTDLSSLVDSVNSSISDLNSVAAEPATTVAPVTSPLPGGQLDPSDPNAGPSQGISAPTLGLGQVSASSGSIGTVPATTNIPVGSGITSAAPVVTQPIAINSGGSGSSPQTATQASAAVPTPGVASVGGGQVAPVANPVDSAAVASSDYETTLHSSSELPPQTPSA